ncbi:dihydropteroate synthase [Azonexus sp.]|uniref:dihydropteroate synthase n=1 Tax=Azonexus sp. TaxID=1872668 RepID=UPI0035B3A384
MNTIHCGAYRLGGERPLLMGIVNLTPDSFSGDGLASDTAQAIAHARRQLEAGADILDLGAESSRPGAQPTPADEELRRLLPVLKELAGWGVPISVDTYKPQVMRAALAAGAAMINDISGLATAEALAAVAGSDCGVCVMHMQGNPGSMQQAPLYQDVVGEVSTWLAAAVERCQRAGIVRERIVVDPGFGFGKTLAHNLALFRAIETACWGGLPVLVGVSRKSMLGQITGQPVSERRAASVAAALLAAQRGAAILRVHDVAETRDALAVWSAIENRGNDE